jgi:hypothetical protein
MFDFDNNCFHYEKNPNSVHNSVKLGEQCVYSVEEPKNFEVKLT